MYLVRLKKYTKIILPILFILGFIEDVFYIVPTKEYGSDIRLFVLLAVWVGISLLFKFKSITNFKLLLFFLIILIFLFIFYPTSPSVERLALWVYMYFLIGIIQQFLELKRFFLLKKKNSHTSKKTKRK